MRVANGMGAARQESVTIGMGILWFLICAPIGYMQWGQGAKGFAFVFGVIVFSIITLGVGTIAGIAVTVDYWMCWNIQQKRTLAPWEFFPTN